MSGLAGLAVALLAACSGGRGVAPHDQPAGYPTATHTSSPTASAARSPTGATSLAAAGDIASCASANDEMTAAVALDGAERVLTLGDHVYPSGSSERFAECYDPGWGQLRSRTHPAPGNHDYEVDGGAPYHEYFGAAAGTPGMGWYSFDLGSWHVIALNSNCAVIDGCEAISPQGLWLATDLASHPAECTLAFWHHPRWSSGHHGNHDMMDPLWRLLVEAGVDVVLSGHDHDYERFAPMDGDGGADTERGIRSFVVGTGGAALRPFRPARPNSEARNADSFGVLRLALDAGRYEWEFVPVTGSFRDSGSAACH